jgi:hypothetical protein
MRGYPPVISSTAKPDLIFRAKKALSDASTHTLSLNIPIQPEQKNDLQVLMRIIIVLIHWTIS